MSARSRFFVGAISVAIICSFITFCPAQRPVPRVVEQPPVELPTYGVHINIEHADELMWGCSYPMFPSELE